MRCRLYVIVIIGVIFDQIDDDCFDWLDAWAYLALLQVADTVSDAVVAAPAAAAQLCQLTDAAVVIAAQSASSHPRRWNIDFRRGVAVIVSLTGDAQRSSDYSISWLPIEASMRHKYASMTYVRAVVTY